MADTFWYDFDEGPSTTQPPVGSSWVPSSIMAMSVFGGISNILGSYRQAEMQKRNLEFQSSMAAMNARLAEKQAQSILAAGEQQQGIASMKAGKVKSAQLVSQAARGLKMGVGSAAEEIATTDLMKEVDMLTINANAVRAASAARISGVNEANQGLISAAEAKGISPMAYAGKSFLDSATSVASTWYRLKKDDLLAQESSAW